MMSMRNLLSACFLALVLVACEGSAQVSGGTALLASSDLPGFYLHGVEQVRCTLAGMQEEWRNLDWPRLFPGLTERVMVLEDWRTITLKDYARFRKGQLPEPSFRTVGVDRHIFSTPGHAANFARYCLSRGWKETTVAGVGTCWVSEKIGHPPYYSFNAVLAQGNTAVEIQTGGPNWDRTQAESVVRTVATRLRPTNEVPLSIQAYVVSKHVKPHKNERAEVRISSNSHPVGYQVLVKRQGQVIYQTQVGGQTGPYLFVWNGLTIAGQRAQNGDHDVVITATDHFGRRATQSVKIVVNFQGQ